MSYGAKLAKKNLMRKAVNKRMRIVWMSWKDREHPLRGGAEVVADNILRRLVADGHSVTLLTADYAGAKPFDDMSVVRQGNRFTVYYHAWRHYQKHLRGQTDLVIDEMNTIPFFARWHAGAPTVLFVHQLARQIWFYQLPWFVGWIGYLAEPLYLYLLRKQPVITVSDSTKKDLMKYGFNDETIHIISEGIHLKRLRGMSSVKKFKQPTMLSHGTIRAMKRTLDQVKAFEIAKSTIPTLQLKISGDSNDPYGQEVLSYAARSPFAGDIEYMGRVSDEQKLELMQRSHFIAVTSVKEGWGLIVSEAASQGTPSVVYNVDGLRDSVQHNRTGVIVDDNTPAGLARGIQTLLGSPRKYEELRRSGWMASGKLTFKRCYQDFLSAVKEII
jgi:glycosyltransferase involved in cell wall biosynthesis